MAEALKIKWIKDILQRKEGWVSIFAHCAGRQYNAAMWQLDQRSLIKIKSRLSCANPFWSSIIDTWAKLVAAAEVPSELPNYSFENAWYITNINIKRLQPVLNGKGVYLIRDLLDSQGNRLSYQEFKRIHNIQINFMDFLSLQKSIPRTGYHEIQALEALPEVRDTSLVKFLKKSEQVCKWAYGELIKKLKIKEPYKHKWATHLNTIEDEEWKHYHCLPFTCTQNTKLQSFQYKIVHHILATQKTLKMCSISETDICTFCENAVETIQHLLFNCPRVRRIWGELAEWLMPTLDISDLISERNVLLGSFSNELINLIFLIVKKYIYSSKFRETTPNINGAKSSIKQEYLIERNIARRDVKQLIRFNTKWNHIAPALNAI